MSNELNSRGMNITTRKNVFSNGNRNHKSRTYNSYTTENDARRNNPHKNNDNKPPVNNSVLNKKILTAQTNKIKEVFDEVVLFDDENGFDYDIKIITKKIEYGSVIVRVSINAKNNNDYVKYVILTLDVNKTAVHVNIIDITERDHPKTIFVADFPKSEETDNKLIKYLPKIIFSIEKDIIKTNNKPAATAIESSL